jgi:mycothiol synthase
MTLNIRRFIQGADEPIWVDVFNAANREHDDWREISLEEAILSEKRPGFDRDGRFIAEAAGLPVGIAHANVDKLRDDGRGFIRFGVVPDYRGRGLEQQLIRTALEELKIRGMTIAQTWTTSRKTDYVQLLEDLGFERVRVFSMMEADLADVTYRIGENQQVTIRSLRTDVEEDIELLTWLENESFKEHFNYRPSTLEETRHHLLNLVFFKEQHIFFAALNDENVGYVGVGIDEKYNLEKKAQAGEIFSIGVLKTDRRTGIGTRLMLHALETLRAGGMTKAMLGVDDSNPTEAIKLYENVGFKVKKKDFIYERRL